MRKVWVVKQAGHDLSGAAKYGELVTVFDPEFSPFMVERAGERVAQVFKDNPPSEDDYILFSGPTSLNVVVAMALLQCVPSVRCLIFHARDRKYVVRDLFASNKLLQETADAEEPNDGTGASL